MKKYRRKRKPEKVMTTEQRTEKQAQQYKKRLKAKKRRRKFVLCVFLLLIVAAIMVFTPVFDITKIEVKGNSKVSTEEIIQTGRIFTGDNIWLFRRGRAEKLIGEIPYVDSVEVSRSLPGKIKVAVKESKEYGCVKVEKGRYLIVDRNGKILQVTKKASKKLKEINVSKVSNAYPGEPFADEGTLVGKSYKLILSYLKKNGYEDATTLIEIKGDDIRFKYNDLVVIIGDTSELEYKFAFIKTFLEERGDDVEGCFDISAPNVGGYYKETYDENEVVKVKSEEKTDEESDENTDEESSEQSEEEAAEDAAQ